MPQYTYACAKCGHQLQHTAKISDAPLTDCPQCPGRLHRVPVATAPPVLRGRGWAKDGYSSGSDGK